MRKRVLLLLFVYVLLLFSNQVLAKTSLQESSQKEENKIISSNYLIYRG